MISFNANTTPTTNRINIGIIENVTAINGTATNNGLSLALLGDETFFSEKSEENYNEDYNCSLQPRNQLVYVSEQLSPKYTLILTHPYLS